jgi:hypothetical protein
MGGERVKEGEYGCISMKKEQWNLLKLF